MNDVTRTSKKWSTAELAEFLEEAIKAEPGKCIQLHRSWAVRILDALKPPLAGLAPEPPAEHGPCPNCGAKWVSAELSSSQAELPKPINHDLWRHLHDEHGLTLLQSELDEIIRLAQPPAEAHWLWVASLALQITAPDMYEDETWRVDGHSGRSHSYRGATLVEALKEFWNGEIRTRDVDGNPTEPDRPVPQPEQPPSDDVEEIDRLRHYLRRVREVADANGDKQAASLCTAALLPTLTKRACQHDLLAPNPTVTVDPTDPFAAHCDVCGYKWKTRASQGERNGE